MAERAQVASLDALESFRAGLIVFLSKARPALEDICDEVRRTRSWLESDRRVYWENQVRVRSRELEQARQELFGASLSGLRQPTAAHQANVARAQAALRQAEEKVQHTRQWIRELENQTLPLTRQLDQLNSFLAADLVHAVAYLEQIRSTLEAYTQMMPGAALVHPAAAGGTSEGAPGADGAHQPPAGTEVPKV